MTLLLSQNFSALSLSRPPFATEVVANGREDELSVVKDGEEKRNVCKGNDALPSFLPSYREQQHHRIWA